MPEHEIKGYQIFIGETLTNINKAESCLVLLPWGHWKLPSDLQLPL